MTKGEVLQQLGLVQLRPDLDEEADEDFIKCMKAIKICCKRWSKEKEREQMKGGEE